MRKQSFKLPGGMPGSRDIKITDYANWYEESKPPVKKKGQQKADDWEIRRDAKRKLSRKARRANR